MPTRAAPLLPALASPSFSDIKEPVKFLKVKKPLANCQVKVARDLIIQTAPYHGRYLDVGSVLSRRLNFPVSHVNWPAAAVKLNCEDRMAYLQYSEKNQELQSEQFSIME